MSNRPIRVLHYLNQFYGGIGGEEKADAGLLIREGPVGPGLALQEALGERGRLAATLIAGDNFFNSQMAEARQAVLDAVRDYRPDVVIAGPAFNAGRYGIACGEVCKTVTAELGVASVTAMSRENPAVSLYRRHTYILPTSDFARTMREVLVRLADFACRLVAGSITGPADREGFVPRGVRRLVVDEMTAAKRAVNMLKAKLSGEAFVTEVPVESFDRAEPSAPVADLSKATLAIVTTSGLVPAGNPDGLRNLNESRWKAYSVNGLDSLTRDHWEPVHGGYDARFAKENPNQVVPLDVLREMEREGAFGRLYPFYLMTVGVGTPVEVCKRMGEEIADELHRANVSAAILTSN